MVGQQHADGVSKYFTQAIGTCFVSHHLEGRSPCWNSTRPASLQELWIAKADPSMLIARQLTIGAAGELAMMYRTVGNGHVLLTGGLSAPVKHKLGCPPPKRGLIKHHARHVTAGIFGGLFGGSKGSTKTCKKCQGKGAIPCPGCKGTGRNKKNGNMFERWKCYDCQGFGQITCPLCGGGEGLTPEQRRER